jgi:hypothetical protein
MNKDLTFQLYTFVVPLKDDTVCDNRNIKTLLRNVVLQYSDYLEDGGLCSPNYRYVCS